MKQMGTFDPKMPVVTVDVVAGICGNPKDPAALREFGRAKSCLARMSKMKLKGLQLDCKPIADPTKFQDVAIKPLQAIPAFKDLQLQGAVVVALDKSGYPMGCYLSGWSSSTGFYRTIRYGASKWYGKNPDLLIKDIKRCIPAYKKTKDRDYVNAALLLLRTEEWVDGVLKDAKDDPTGEGRMSKREKQRWLDYKKETDKLRALILDGLKETVGQGMAWTAKGWVETEQSHNADQPKKP